MQKTRNTNLKISKHEPIPTLVGDSIDIQVVPGTSLELIVLIIAECISPKQQMLAANVMLDAY